MVKSRRLLGLPVIDIENGKAVGRISRLVVDPRARRVAAMVVITGPWAKEEQVLPWDRARGVGEAAVTVRGSGALAPAGAVPELAALLRRPVRLYGARVLTEDGAYLGAVEEVLIDPATGAVTQLLLAAHGLGARLRAPTVLSADSLLVMGEDAIVAREGSQPSPLRASAVRSGIAAASPGASRARQGSSTPDRPAANGPTAPGSPGRAWVVLGRMVAPVREATRRGLEHVAHRNRSGP